MPSNKGMFNLHPDATIDGDAIHDNTYLFETTPELLPLSLTTSEGHTELDLKSPATDAIQFPTFENLVYEDYNESGPSSIHQGEPNDVSETSGGHISCKEDVIPARHMFVGDPNAGSKFELRPIHIQPTRQETLFPLTQPAKFHSMNESISRSNSEDSFKTAASAMDVSEEHAPILVGDKRQKEFMNSTSAPSSRERRTSQVKSEQSPATPKSSAQHIELSRIPSHHAPFKKVSQPFRARASIPTSISAEEFARQCILAAYSSRLNPYALHPDENTLLKEHLSYSQVTTYLNIRNAILRLWTKNPLVSITPDEAAGCARDARFFELAQVAYQWLLRNGYINFGCVEVQNTALPIPRAKARGNKRRTVIVIGAGMSGIGCARQLEALFSQLGNEFASKGEKPPKVVVLEGRGRIGGRVYSHQLQSFGAGTLPSGLRNTAEMGAQIITGFEHGNPLNIIVRGQLGLPYHGLRDNTILYDYDGVIVERDQDIRMEKLYNDALERASMYRHKVPTLQTVEGDRTLIAFGREPGHESGPSIADVEKSSSDENDNLLKCSATIEKPATGVEKRAGRAYVLSGGLNPNIPAAEAAKSMGCSLKHGILDSKTLDLDCITKSSSHPTLGQTMDEAFRQYQQILNITPRDMRLLNWHNANLEYANAINIDQLSLGGWDQDIGNEFEGEHSQIIGGYQQVPRGLWLGPTQLDIRFNHAAKTIHHRPPNAKTRSAIRVECHNGEVFEGDEVIITAPLGVLKEGSIQFEPALPQWKQEVIKRMGFGLLNKIVLVYETSFWEEHRDMFGLLNEAEIHNSLQQKHYTHQRGKFFLFWNCIKTSGRPVLVALMAGDAAHQTEERSSEELVQEVTEKLRKMFSQVHVPLPIEAIVTRWSRDPFARGSYSYVGAQTQPGDYDLMAQSVGTLHFAGEATCGTHPATVHGAYISGLRAAAEVMESMLGPIKVPDFLIPSKAKHETAGSLTTPKSGAIDDSFEHHAKLARQAEEEYEACIIGAILKEIGDRPVKPGKIGVNPFLLYTKNNWHICKENCDNSRRLATGDPNAKATRTEIRIALGKMWRDASDIEKQPYLEATQNAKVEGAATAANFKERIATWDREASRIREEYIKRNPLPNMNTVSIFARRASLEHGEGRRVRRTDR